MFEPFVMIAMCDCTIDKKTHKKVCTSFLRAFANGCNGIHIVGDYDHNGKPYKPKGVVSSDAKCCDCCESDKKVEVCYDLKCLIRRQERNGGLENIAIKDSNGVSGAIVNFSPPANDTLTIAEKLNQISYLGYTSWYSSPEKPGFLCVSVAPGSLIPKEATGCRFRRFRTNKTNRGPTMSISHPGYGAYSTTQDNVSAGAPNVTNPLILNSNTHYYCNLRLERTIGFGTSSMSVIDVAQPFVANVLQQANIFRLEFPDNSTSMYVPNYPTNSSWNDIWPTGNVTLASNRAIWAANLQNWIEYVIGQGLSYGNSKCYTSWSTTEDPTNTTTTIDIYIGDIIIDVPSNIFVKTIYGIQMNPIEISTSGIVSAGNNHLKYFDELIGVGNYTSKPYVDGIGGSTDWSSDCSIASPFSSDSDNLTNRAAKKKAIL